MATTIPPQALSLPQSAVVRTAEEARAAVTTAVDPYGDHPVVTEVRDALCDGLTLAEAVEDWRDRIDAWNRRGQTVALWGAPERAAVFLALLDLGCPVDAVVSEQAGVLAPLGIPLAPARRLVEDPPSVVVTVGPDDVDTVRDALESHGIAARVYGLDA